MSNVSPSYLSPRRYVSGAGEEGETKTNHYFVMVRFRDVLTSPHIAFSHLSSTCQNLVMVVVPCPSLLPLPHRPLPRRVMVVVVPCSCRPGPF